MQLDTRSEILFSEFEIPLADCGFSRVYIYFIFAFFINFSAWIPVWANSFLISFWNSNKHSQYADSDIVVFAAIIRLPSQIRNHVTFISLIITEPIIMYNLCTVNLNAKLKCQL